MEQNVLLPFRPLETKRIEYYHVEWKAQQTIYLYLYMLCFLFFGKEIKIVYKEPFKYSTNIVCIS
jgi:hypothetical protein